MDTHSVLMNNKYTPEQKVYLIAHILGDKVDDDLRYAILDLKEKYYMECAAARQDYDLQNLENAMFRDK